MPPMTRTLAAFVLGLALFTAGCGGSSSRPAALIVVDAPFSTSSYRAETIAKGVELGAQNKQKNGMQFRVQRLDNAGSAAASVRNVRRAVAEHAVAIVSDGTGVDASWQIANRAKIPICVVFDGGGGLVDPARRPNVFRIAPTDRGIAFRYAEYLIPKKLKVAFLTDDTGYGLAGRAALDNAFSGSRSVAARIDLPTDATDLAPQVLVAHRSGATALLVWAQPAAIAEAVVAARTAGWNVPIFTSPSGEDPLVRQELAAHRSWVDGLTFASGRMTAEVGPVPFYAFENRFESVFGVQKVGVVSAGRRPIVQPPDDAMYPYDFVTLLAAAVRAAHSMDGAKVIAELNQVSAEGANGDSRGFNLNNHEGVVDDDVYFARFKGMEFFPVKDDALSSTLPPIPQER